MTTKLTRLTPQNVHALRICHEAIGLTMILEKTTVEFDATPAEVVAGIERAVAANPRRGHPKASLYAVRRKAAALQGEQ